MGQHKLSEAARFLNKLDFMRRLATAGAALRNSPAKFTPVPRSERNQRRDAIRVWQRMFGNSRPACTKKHTLGRYYA